MTDYRNVLRHSSMGCSQGQMERDKVVPREKCKLIYDADRLNIHWPIDSDITKVIKAYKKVDLLILDEWLMRCLTPNESYNLLEIVEARIERSMIFCTQYHTEGWYDRIHSDPNNDSPVSDVIIDRMMAGS